ncbi:MAG TPA: DUF1592 domain-containing protein, partial [Gemmataceae bacterium]|nr:DUF1592 domain-containing protein [Gemmataceae bacterium]
VGPARAAEARAPGTFARQVAPLLKPYCTTCHGGAKPRGHLALDGFHDDASAAAAHDVWERVLKNVRSGDMPPPKKPRPTPEEVAQLTAWVGHRLAHADCGRIDPGHPTLRRLNRAEYDNTVRDLVGVPFQPAEDFPADDVGNGFDNMGDVLSLPPLLLEKYLAAAEKVVDAAFGDPELRRRILVAEPSPRVSTLEASRKVIESFARRAYRRPVTPDEVNRLCRFVRLAESQGDGFEKGIRLALEAVLVSPHFLFHVELDPQPRNALRVHAISDYELASRLSYFLWSSMPDDELFGLARQGTLHRPAVLEAQVRRMLRDPKARALVENFGDQWLEVRNLKTVAPDPGRFPDFDDALRADMLRETELFFGAVVREDRSVLDFLDADYTFLNERLARHYGIPGVQGEEFRRVLLHDGRRGGVITQASVLTVTSNPTRTSPVKRGKWILEVLLGAPPPPPPPNVPELNDKPSAVRAGTLRQRMEQHRANPSCAACHQRMDPLGFGLENYDAVGGWRVKEGDFAIDASGTLPGGQSFNGPEGLKKVLEGRSEEFCRCLGEKMLTYALGRGLESYDQCTVDRIVKALKKDNYRFSALVLEVVKSEPFQKRRGKGGRR